MFCEIFNTKASYENFDILDLFDEYFEKKAQGDVEDNLFDDKQEVFDTINLITNWMLSNNLFDKAPLNCFEKTERSNIIKLVDGDIFNISNDGHDEYVGFVFEEFRDYFVSLSLKNKSCDELSYFFEDKMDMEGLLRNVILLRRKNKSNKKTDDSKFQWYRDGTAEVIQNLPLQSLDQIDKEIAVEKIESLSYTEMNDLKTINNLILLFLHTNLSNPLFRIECLVNLKGNGQENIKNFMSTEYLFVDLLNDLENSKCNCKYLKVLISMIVKMNISLPSNIKDRVKNILLVTFNVKKINELLLFGFGKDEINFFGEEKQYEIFKD